MELLRRSSESDSPEIAALRGSNRTLQMREQIACVPIAVAALIIIALIAAGVRRSRTVALREHFGSEYQREVKQTGSRTAAEDRLVARAEEAKEFEIRSLTASERSRFIDDWKKIDAAEIARGLKLGKLREKFVTVEGMLTAL